MTFFRLTRRAPDPEPVTTLKILHFDIVDGCQLRCVGCPNSTIIRKPSFATPELFRACVRNLDVLEVKELRLFNFGEPLLHPQIDLLGRILRDEARFAIGAVELSTNGQSKSYERLAGLVESGMLQRLAISCDGDGTAASYEALRPPAKWSQLMAFLAFAQELRQRYPSLEVITRTIIQTADDAQRWRAVLSPFSIAPVFRGWKHLPNASRNMTGREIEVGKGVCFHVAEPDRLYVNHLGEVVTCCIHPKAGVLGNLGKRKHSEILTGRERLAFIESMARNRASMPVCGECEFGPADDRGPSAGVALGFKP